MDRKEAIERIKRHMIVHQIGVYPHIKLAEALLMAIAALQEPEHRCENCGNAEDAGVRIYCLLHTSFHRLDEYCSEWEAKEK